MKMDLTPTQRLEEKKLLVERNKRWDEDETNVVKSHTRIIRTGMIIKILKNHPTERRKDRRDRQRTGGLKCLYNNATKQTILALAHYR